LDADMDQWVWYWKHLPALFSAPLMTEDDETSSSRHYLMLDDVALLPTFVGS
jgi:hypothetical protein